MQVIPSLTIMTSKTSNVPSIGMFTVDGGYVHKKQTKRLPFELTRDATGLVRLSVSPHGWDLDGLYSLFRHSSFDAAFGTIVLCNLPDDYSWFNGVYNIVRVATFSDPSYYLRETTVSADVVGECDYCILAIQGGVYSCLCIMNDLDLAANVVELVWDEMESSKATASTPRMQLLQTILSTKRASEPVDSAKPRVSYDDYIARRQQNEPILL